MRPISYEDVEKAQANIAQEIDNCMNNLVLNALGEIQPDNRQHFFQELGRLRHLQQIIGEYYGNQISDTQCKVEGEREE